MSAATERVLIKGNEAVAFGAIDAGCRCYFGYPITPQNEVPEALSTLLPEAGGQFVQAESEVGAINMVLGAAASGGPGPLVSHFAQMSGQLPCPVYIIPGGIGEADLARLS